MAATGAEGAGTRLQVDHHIPTSAWRKTPRPGQHMHLDRAGTTLLGGEACRSLFAGMTAELTSDVKGAGRPVADVDLRRKCARAQRPGDHAGRP